MARINFYGRLADRHGRVVPLGVDESGITIAALRKCFDGLDPATVRACVNGEIVREEALVTPGDEVDFLPPLSGG